MQSNGVRPVQKWRWAGDEIVSPAIPASRKVPGSKIARFPMDVRGFLAIEHDAVVRSFLQDKIIAPLPSAVAREKFWRDGQGNFDFRIGAIKRAFQALNYLNGGRRFDAWQFPEETLVRRGGDCEDLAFLLAALLEAAGISPDCIRVALGAVVDHSRPRQHPHDHAWVMYQTEKGMWLLLDPVSWVRETSNSGHGGRAAGRTPPADLEYIPYYVFNRHHLWRIRSPHSFGRTETLPGYLSSRKFWTHFTPRFGKQTHETIFKKALAGISGADLDSVEWTSLGVDANVFSYDPRDHFDFAYIPESWQRVRERLATGRLADFALAGHAIGDFYAHSLYAHIVKPGVSGELPACDPDNLPPVGNQLDFLFTDPKFVPKDAPHDSGWSRQHWTNTLVSGQWWRWFTTYPDDIQNPAELETRRCLPDHDQVAVDAPQGGGGSHLYNPADYAAQFILRRDTAIAHLGKEWDKWKKLHYKQP